MRPTLVDPSSNCATVTPPIPSLCTAAGATAPVTSAPDRSTTRRAGCDSLNALKSGFCVPCTTTRGPSTSIAVTRFAPAPAFAGSAAQRTSAAAVQTNCSFMTFSWPTLAAPGRLRLLRSRHHFFAFLERLQIRLLFRRSRHLEGDVLRINAAGVVIGDGLGDHDLIPLDGRHLAPVLSDEVAEPDGIAVDPGISHHFHHRHRRGGARHRQGEAKLVERPLLQRSRLAALVSRLRLAFADAEDVLERVALADRRVDVHRLLLLRRVRLRRRLCGTGRRGSGGGGGRRAAASGAEQSKSEDRAYAVHFGAPGFGAAAGVSGTKRNV